MDIPAPFEETTEAIPKCALVTGGGHRVGRGIALDLADHGWSVAVHYNRSADAAEEVAAAIREKGAEAVTVGGDLSRESDVIGLVDQAAAALGPLGLLVNNASVFERDTALTATRESWDTHMETNLRAPFVMMQALARQRPQGASAVIVNIIDQRVWNLTHDFTSYTLSKAGLWALTQTMALSLAPEIRVAAIGPGPVLPSTRQSDEQFRRQWESMPLARGAMPSEIAAAVRFIVETPSYTGQMLALDGGQHLNWAPLASGALAEE